MREIGPERGEPNRPPPFPTQVATSIPPVKAKATLNYWRLLRLVFALQGLYYSVAGLWPLLARVLPLPPLFSATNLGVDFSGTLGQALTALVGLVLLLSAARPRPDGLLVGLGAGAALAFFLTELRFRGALRGLIYADLALEVIFFLALSVLYLAAVIGDRRRR
jgi:hypothetical protein